MASPTVANAVRTQPVRPTIELLHSLEHGRLPKSSAHCQWSQVPTSRIPNFKRGVVQPVTLMVTINLGTERRVANTADSTEAIIQGKVTQNENAACPIDRLSNPQIYLLNW